MKRGPSARYVSHSLSAAPKGTSRMSRQLTQRKANCRKSMPSASMCATMDALFLLHGTTQHSTTQHTGCWCDVPCTQTVSRPRLTATAADSTQHKGFVKR